MTDHATIRLARGSHSADQDCGDPQRCFFECYNWITRQVHTAARPPGVSPVLHQYGMSLNDLLGDETRRKLVRFLPNGTDRLAGTEYDGNDESRRYLAFDWLIRTYLPAFLELAGGLGAEASALRDLRRITDLAAAQSAGPVVRDASDKAYAAWSAAWDAAGAAAWDAARTAAWDAVWDAAGYAAGGAARTAAWDAARDTARDTARDAVRDTAWDAAGAAARAAAWTAAWTAAGDTAGDTAWDAARAKLAPTVAMLQDSAIDLYDRMIGG